MDLLKFWTDCRDRRLEHLAMHQESFDTLLKGNGPAQCLLIQRRWLIEASDKVKHAEAMVHFFESRQHLENQRGK